MAVTPETLERVGAAIGSRYVCFPEHTLLEMHLDRMRDQETSIPAFNWHAEEATRIMFSEHLRDATPRRGSITTPVGTAPEGILDIPLPYPIAIERAGTVMADTIRRLGDFRMGTAGLHRDPATRKPVWSGAFKVDPEQTHREALVVDPMLATGGTAHAVLEKTFEAGFQNVVFMGLFAAPEGILFLLERFPEQFAQGRLHVQAGMYCTKGLDGKDYIIDGPGDAGDRFYGPKEKPH